jgi:hypothetical protein
MTKPVTSYEPTAEEAFAETMRIFIMNPALLSAARPCRYAFLTTYFKPLHNLEWWEVLKNAPDFILQSAKKFTLEGNHEQRREARCQTLL